MNTHEINFLISRAIQHVKARQFSEAETLCKFVLQQDEKNDIAYRTLGFVYLTQQKLQQAIISFEIAYALDETDFIAGEDLARAYVAKGDLRESVKIHKQRLKYFPNNQEIIESIFDFYKNDGGLTSKVDRIRLQVSKFADEVVSVQRHKIMFGMSFSIYMPCRIHDFLLSQALILRGSQIVPIICGAAQEGECNVFGGVWGGYTGAIEPDAKRSLQNCQTCMNADYTLWNEWAGIKPVPLLRYINPIQKYHIRQIVNEYKMTDYTTWTYEEMPVGQWAVDVLRNNELVGDETLVKDFECKLKRYLFNILVVIEASKLAIADIVPDAIVANDSFYYQWAVLEKLALRNAIPFYSHWAGGRRMGWCYAFNEPAMNLNLAEIWEDYQKQRLEDYEIRIVDDFLKDRPLGHSMILNTADPKQNCDEQEIQHEHLNFDKPTALLAANVIWDLAALNKEVQFTSMVDWVCQTIEFFRDHPEWQLIIKPHPTERNKNLPITRQPLGDEIGKHVLSLPDNVIVLNALTNLSVYDLMPHVTLGLVFTTTVGIEMTCQGIPVITAGRSAYHGKGFTYDPETREDYFQAIDYLMRGGGITEREERKRQARTFLYIYLFRYYTSLNLFDHTFKNTPLLLISDATELLPGANKVLDYICDSILNHLPIVSKDRLPPLGGERRGLYNFLPDEIFLGGRLALKGYTNRFSETVIGNHNGLIKMLIDNFEFNVPAGLFKPGELLWIYNEVFLSHDENPHAYNTEFTPIRTGDVLIDAGACMGFFTKLALNCGAKKIYAFEPHVAMRSGLQRTFIKEIDEGRIALMPYALTNVNGTLRFDNGQKFICEARLNQDGENLVETITLDNFIQQNHLCSVDFMKIDVEGEELNLILGSLELLRRFKPRLAIAVYHGYDNAQKVQQLILKVRPDYRIVFGGCYMFETPFRPYMLYAI